MFVPEKAIFPAGDDDAEILIAGKVNGKLRNVTVTDEDLGARLRAAVEKRDAAHKAITVKRDAAVKTAEAEQKVATEEFNTTFESLQDEAFSAAIERFDAANASKKEE